MATTVTFTGAAFKATLPASTSRVPDAIAILQPADATIDLDSARIHLFDKNEDQKVDAVDAVIQYRARRGRVLPEKSEEKPPIKQDENKKPATNEDNKPPHETAPAEVTFVPIAQSLPGKFESLATAAQRSEDPRAELDVVA